MRPTTAAGLERVAELLGSDEMLLFSTDFPHWHFDGHDALPVKQTTSALARRVLCENAVATYPTAERRLRLKSGAPVRDGVDSHRRDR